MSRKDKNRVPAESAEPKRVTPVDIQHKEFRESFKGYNEREVDEFLDLVTEEVARLHAENKRLQEQMEFRHTVPFGGVNQEAEEILRRARQEADRIIAEARATAAEPVQPGGDVGLFDAGETINRFLGRERTFLQALASRIQEHIEAVRDDARSAKRGIEGEIAGTRAAEAEPPADPEQDEAAGAGTGSFEDAGGPATSWMRGPVEAEETAGGGFAGPAEDDRVGSTPDSAAESPWAPPEGPSTQGWEDPPSFGGRASADQSEPAAGVTAAAGPTATAGPEEDGGQDRSLRELFWGED